MPKLLPSAFMHNNSHIREQADWHGELELRCPLKQ